MGNPWLDHLAKFRKSPEGQKLKKEGKNTEIFIAAKKTYTAMPSDGEKKPKKAKRSKKSKKEEKEKEDSSEEKETSEEEEMKEKEEGPEKGGKRKSKKGGRRKHTRRLRRR